MISWFQAFAFAWVNSCRRYVEEGIFLLDFELKEIKEFEQPVGLYKLNPVDP